METQRFHDVRVTYLKCDHYGCTTLPAEFSDTNGGIEQARMQGWWTYGEVLCPIHNPTHQPATQTATEYWGEKFGWNHAANRNV